MTFLPVILKTERTDLPGFNKDNQYTLKFNVPSNSPVQDLLNNFNAHRRPSKQVVQVTTITGEVANQHIINKKSHNVFIIP
jgi:hypothetical protein